MKCDLRTAFPYSLFVSVAIAADLSLAQAQAPSVPGVYLLLEVNGNSLPAVTGARSSNGERCQTEVLDGAVLFGSDGQSAAFVTEREVCAFEDRPETTVRQESVIFVGSYEVSGNQITINDDFGTDYAVRDGDLLIYTTDPGATEYVLQKQ